MAGNAVPKPAVVADVVHITALGARIRREQIRWESLVHLDGARPYAMTDQALLPLIQAVRPDVPMLELRRELDYLEGHRLLTIARGGLLWSMKLSSEGIDVVEYTTSCPAGIGRPANSE